MHKERESTSISWAEFTRELAEAIPATDVIRQFLSHSSYPQRDLPAADRWMLVSNLHKSIRFGLVEQASATADALHLCDPGYFYRRLPVIALEDVSLGNLPVCFEILTLCRDLTLRRKFQGRGLARYIGAKLAATHKSRSACDLLSLVGTSDARPAGFGCTPVDGAELDIASSDREPIRTRAAVLLKLDQGLSEDGGNSRASLGVVASRLGLPSLLIDTLMCGGSTHGLNAMLALIYELMAQRPLRVEVASTNLAPLDNSILCAAADQYTRLGREAIGRWMRSTRELSALLKMKGSQKATEIVGMALFHIEGSLLNTRLTNDCLEILREETERAELARLGISPNSSAELYAVMRSNLGALNDTRRKLWKSR